MTQENGSRYDSVVGVTMTQENGSNYDPNLKLVLW